MDLTPDAAPPAEATPPALHLDPNHSSRSWRRRLPLLVLMTGLAVLLNALPLPLYFGVQVLLGSVPPILALLLWRSWWAVAMGALASLQTWHLWGHPWAVVIFSLEMVWLTLALRRGNGPASNDGNGRVVLFSIAYWLLLGTPLVLLFYGLVLRFDLTNVLVVAAKQSFNGVFNTGLAFAALIAIRAIQARQSQAPGLSLRGVIMALLLLAITVPTLVISQLAGQQLEIAEQQGALDGLRTVSLAVSHSKGNDQTTRVLMRQLGGDLTFRRMEDNGAVSASDLTLFQRLDRDFQDSGRTYVRNKELALLIPRGRMPLLRKWVNGYWSYSHQYLSSGGATTLVQVVEPSRTIVTRMQQQSTWLLINSLIVMVAGALIGYWLGHLFEREFRRVIAPLHGSASQLVPLQLSSVFELRNLALLINHRIRQVNRLGQQLRQANSNLRQSRADLKRLLSVDPLTGCGHRQALLQRLGEEWVRCRHSGEALSCLCLDVDNLAAINREHGYQSGNALLQGLTQAARPRLRITDHLYRHGDAFVVLSTGRLPEEARQLADELLNAMDAMYLSCSGADGQTQELRARVHVGISSLEPSDDRPEGLLTRAHQALERNRAVRGKLEASER